MADKVFSHFVPFFVFWPSEQPKKNQNFEKMKKSNLWYYHFTLVYHKWRSYDACFLRYGAWQTKFFVILDYFLPFYPRKSENYNPENQNFEKMKKKPKVYQKSWLYTILFLRYGMWWMYSQTCIRQPLLGPLKSGCPGQVAL